MRRKRHFKTNIIGLKDNEGKTIFAPSAQAEFLKDLYSSIFREDNARPTPTLTVPTAVMPLPQISTLSVHKELSSLNISNGAGPDEIHPQIFAWLADFLAEPLFKLLTIFADSLPGGSP